MIYVYMLKGPGEVFNSFLWKTLVSQTADLRKAQFQ